MTTKRKRTRRPAHLPALPDAQRRAIIEQLAASTLHPDAKRQLIAMLEAAANPAAEAPEVVIQSLEAERRDNILATIDTLNRFTGGLAARGTARLLEMSDADFNALVDAANDE